MVAQTIQNFLHRPWFYGPMFLSLATPGDWLELLIGPLGFHRGTTPLVTEIIRSVDQFALRFCTATLRESSTTHSSSLP